MQVKCDRCGITAEFSIENWRCSCSGAWELVEIPIFSEKKIRINEYSIWRYGELLGLDIKSPIDSMGVGWTPLVPMRLFDRDVQFKLEFLSPSGSFKDRGVNAMINQLVSMGAETVVEDSSGNAGASVAAHAARFGVDAKIFVPEYASAAKKHQISVYGAEVCSVPGSRQAAEKAAQAAVSPHTAYASHAYNPAYLAGQVSAAYELWEQLGKKAPDWILCPVAQGGQFLGYWFGFRNLLNAGLIDHLPHMVAVQSAQIAPIHNAWKQGLDHIPKIEALGPTIAEGVAVPGPIRDRRILQALHETGGKTLAIEESDILAGQKLASHSGFYIEPTSALVLAALEQMSNEIGKDERIIMPLTGTGLKGEPKFDN